MQILRQSTEIKVVIGPFVDVGDGFTPETGVTLAAADEAELIKHNAAAVTDISGATWAAIADADGWYNLTLTSSFTDTLGLMTVVVQDDSVCLPVHVQFMVVPSNVWDSLFSTDKLQVDCTQIEGSDATDQIRDSVVDDATRIDASALNTLSGYAPGSTIAAATDIPTAATIADAVWDEAAAGHTDAGKAGAQLWTDIDAILVDTGEIGAAGIGLTAITDAITALNDITVADIIAGIAEGSLDLQEMLRIMLAALAGKASGGGTTTIAFRDQADSKDRISATVDSDGNRSAVTVDGS